jgi:hypothetical protein
MHKTAEKQVEKKMNSLRIGVMEVFSVKKSIKKIFAVGVSVALLATTMVGALADLSTYPAPFVDNKGVFNGAIVVGENAATSDVLGAIDIAASLQSEAKKSVSVGDSSVVVEGGESYDEINLGTSWPASGNITLKENKLDGFVDSSFDVDGDDVDYHDELIVVNGSVAMTNPTSEDAAGRVHAIVNQNAIEYRVYFEDAYVDNAIATETAQFKFLGQSVEAYGFNFSATTGDDAFTVVSSTEKSMIQGDEVTIGGHTVKLVRVGSGSVIVDVDGQTKVITDGATESFDDADDFQVEVDSIFYIEGASDNLANLKLGSDLEETAKVGEPAQLFGQPDKVAEADWVWTIGNDGNRYIGIVSNKAYDNLDVKDVEEQMEPLFVGDSISLPNNYASVVLESLAAAYETVTISLDDKAWLDDGEDSPNNEGYYSVVEFSADSDIFKIGAETAETVHRSPQPAPVTQEAA